MKFHLQQPTGQYLFTGYGAGYVTVNGVRHETSLIVTPAQVIADWVTGGFDSLAISHFEYLLTLKPEIVLLGTGPRLRFPSAPLTRPLGAAHVGLEVMDTNAACRTYNILVAEGRGVVAALLL